MYLSGDIILHKCSKNHDHMLYCSWNMACDEYNCYFSFWAMFYPFSPITVQKFKISKKTKKRLEISSFCTSVWKIMIIWYTVPEIWCVMHAIVIFHFGLFFAFLPWKMKICLKNFLEKRKFQKTEKNAWRYHHFTQVYQKKWSYAILFLRYSVRLL